MSLADRVARLRTGFVAAAPEQETVVFGAIAGLYTFLAGYAVTFLSERHWTDDPTRPVLSHFLVAIDAPREVNVGPDGALPSAWQFATWQFHRLHGARLDPRFEVVGQVAPPPRPLVVVPMVFLAGAGALVVARTRADDPWGAAGRGGLVALGYFPLATATAWLSAWVPPESVRIVGWGMATESRPLWTVAVQLPHAVVLTGLVVPVAFGALGGYLAFAWRESRWPRSLLTRGAVAGAGAFAVGWATVRHLTERRLATERYSSAEAIGAVPEGEYTGIAPGEVDPGLNTLATWQYHGLHGGGMAVRYRRAVTDGVDLIEVFELAVSARLVPAVVLLLAGAALVFTTGASTYRTAALRGAAVAVGYLPAAAATAFLSAWTPPAAPDLVLAVSFLDAVQRTGLVSPVVVGGLGGVVAYALSSVAAAVSEYDDASREAYRRGENG